MFICYHLPKITFWHTKISILKICMLIFKMVWRLGLMATKPKVLGVFRERKLVSQDAVWDEENYAKLIVQKVSKNQKRPSRKGNDDKKREVWSLSSCLFHILLMLNKDFMPDMKYLAPRRLPLFFFSVLL